VLLEVGEEDLALMDDRERGYARHTVRAMVRDATVDATAYIVPEADKSRDGRVLRGYTRLLDEALAGYPTTFVRAFWDATEPPPEPLVDGPYRFPPIHAVA
jgi:hypothetical protein